MRGLCRRAGKAQRHPPERHAHRNLVPGRGARRSEEQDHAALGEAWDAAIDTEGSAGEIGLYLRRDLPRTGQGRRAGPALLQYRNHVATSDRNSAAVAPGAHALVLVDQAGWHMKGKLDVPGNISIVALPDKCPERNPVQNIWQFMRDNRLSNRVFTSHDNIVDHCCEAWNRLIDQPWHIMSIGHRKWARGS